LLRDRDGTPRLIPRWQIAVFGIMLLVTLATVGYVGSISRTGFAKTDDLQAQSARVDCARVWNANQNEIIRNADSLDRRVNQEFNRLLLRQSTTGERATESERAAFSALVDEASKANARVEDLNPIDEVVNRHCPKGA
jgi:hypothetical protein